MLEVDYDRSVVPNINNHSVAKHVGDGNGLNYARVSLFRALIVGSKKIALELLRLRLKPERPLNANDMIFILENQHLIALHFSKWLGKKICFWGTEFLFPEGLGIYYIEEGEDKVGNKIWRKQKLIFSKHEFLGDKYSAPIL